MSIAAGGAANPSSLVAMLRSRAERHGSRRAFTYLPDGETREEHLSYAELDRWARAIAARLQGIGATEERALLLDAPGLPYIAAFFGCLYAGVIPVPAYPPRLNRSLERLEAIVVDADPALALTSAEIASGINRRIDAAPVLADVQWFTIEELSAGAPDEWREPSLAADDLAFLQYTSGSTADPKGVMLTHGQLLANLELIARMVRHGEASRGVSWLPPYHDMGLIGAILQTCYAGAFAALMPPVAFLQHPIAWLRAITRYRATGSVAPNFAYELCVQKISPEQRETLDLSNWQVAMNGAEPIRAETIERFVAAFASCGFRREAFMPCYGLAEATLYVSGNRWQTPPRPLLVSRPALEQGRVIETTDDAAASRLVSCGPMPHELRARIVDPERGTCCPPDEIGEIWVSGPSVAAGYWQKPGETVATFQAYVADSGEGPFLRTGDLGFIHQGELFVTGRLKDLVILDGRNHYPQDIELTVEQSDPLVRASCSAAFAVEIDDQERLVIVAEVDRGYRSILAQAGALGEPEDRVTRAIRGAVAGQHGVRVHDIVLVKPGGVPKTSSGKIQRRRCRARYLAGTLDGWGVA